MTAKEIFNKHMDKAGINFTSSLQTYERIIEAMEEYAELKRGETTMTELTTDKIIQYLEQRIKFLREIREDNERLLSDNSDKLRHIWENNEIEIQAKLVEAEMTLHIIKYPDKPLPNVLGK